MGLHFYRLRLRQLMGKPRRQGISKTRANAQYRIRPFDGLFYRPDACRTTVRAIKTGLAFVKNALAHQHGGVGNGHLFHPFLQGMFHAVAQDQEIGQQRGTLACFQPALGDVSERFQAGVIGMRCL